MQSLLSSLSTSCTATKITDQTAKCSFVMSNCSHSNYSCINQSTETFDCSASAVAKAVSSLAATSTALANAGFGTVTDTDVTSKTANEVQQTLDQYCSDHSQAKQDVISSLICTYSSYSSINVGNQFQSETQCQLAAVLSALLSSSNKSSATSDSSGIPGWMIGIIVFASVVIVGIVIYYVAKTVSKAVPGAKQAPQEVEMTSMKPAAGGVDKDLASAIRRAYGANAK
jgi:hypothetical protein